MGRVETSPYPRDVLGKKLMLRRCCGKVSEGGLGEAPVRSFPLNVTDQSTCIENSPAEALRLPSPDYRDRQKADH